MKYPDLPAVDAVYTPNQLSGAQPNPFLEAMPEILSKEALFRRLACSPPQPDAAQLKPSDRRRGLNALSSVFVPMDYMAVVYSTLFCAMESTYTASATIDSIRRVHAIHQGDGAPLAQLPVATSTDSGSILGVPGIGKSSTIRRCLRQIPQVIRHSQYGDNKLFCNQVTWLMVECPGDCSVKTLALNIIEAIDRAIGSSYSDLNQRVARLPSASVLATRVKILCLTHHVGLIVIDEIQNAILTASRNKQSKALIKFLVELSNEACTSIYYVGTPSAEDLFLSQEHLKRRTRGLRLLPMRPDGIYRRFLHTLWPYQYTPERAHFADALVNLVYDLSGGIPAYIVKIFCEAQVQALQAGAERLDDKLIRKAVETFNIVVPKTYAKGTYLSDFSVCDTDEDAETDTEADTAEALEPEPVRRLYAVPRGRPKAKRDEHDILTLVAAGQDPETAAAVLEQAGLLEVFTGG